MSTISVTQRIRTLSTVSNRRLMAFVGSALVVILVAIGIAANASPAANAFDYNAYMLHRQGEWVSVPIPVDIAEAYRIYRQGEVTSPVSNAEAYLIHRQGEWASVAISPVDLTAYYLSERTHVDPNAGLAIYQQSERTFVDPQTGLAIYQQSERTSAPVRFNKYQRSEWFGE